MKKLLSLVLALALVLASCAVAFAADPAGKIVIENAAKGIHYEIFKLFDATTDGADAIAYTGTIPASLTEYFQYVENSGDQYVEETDKTRTGNTDQLTSGAVAALKTWAGTATKVDQADGTGDAVTFDNLGYGYYVITSTQGEGKITVVTLAGNEADIYDKNTTTVIVGKKADDKDVYVGQKVNYTLTVTTSNYMGEGADAKQVITYQIKDTLPEYLDNVKVNSLTIGDQSITPVPQFTNKEIDIEWATANNDGTYTSKYNNGTVITIVYEAVVNKKVYVGDANPNRNVLEVIPIVDDNGPTPWPKHFYDDEKIYTYGAAILKVDEEDKPLTGAKFAVKGLTVEGANGEYTVVNFDANSTTYSADMDVDEEGYLYILGLASDVNLTAKETKAPDGYNIVVTEMTLKPIKMSETVSYTERTIWYDANGEVIYDSGEQGATSTTITANKKDLKSEANVLKVVNKKGTELPSTGGIGTTIFYILGGLLVIGAGVILVARRKAHD